jgi:hypothetical protein
VKFQGSRQITLWAYWGLKDRGPALRSNRRCYRWNNWELLGSQPAKPRWDSRRRGNWQPPPAHLDKPTAAPTGSHGIYRVRVVTTSPATLLLMSLCVTSLHWGSLRTRCQRANGEPSAIRPESPAQRSGGASTDKRSTRQVGLQPIAYCHCEDFARSGRNLAFYPWFSIF